MDTAQERINRLHSLVSSPQSRIDYLHNLANQFDSKNNQIQTPNQPTNNFDKLDSQLKTIRENNKQDGFFSGLSSMISNGLKSYGDTAMRSFIQTNPLLKSLSQANIIPENIQLPNNPIIPSLSTRYSSDFKTGISQGLSDLVNTLPGAQIESKTLSSLIQPIKKVIPKTFGAIKGALEASGYAGLQGASEGLKNENATPSTVLGSALSYATNPLVLAGGALFGTIAGKYSPENIALKQKKVTQAVNDLEETYYKLSTSKPLQKKLNTAEIATQRKNLAGTIGTNPVRTLAEEGIVPEQIGGKIQTLDQANKLREGLKPLNNAQREVLHEMDIQSARAGGTGGVSLSEFENEAIKLARTPQNIDSGKFTGIQKEIQREFEDLRNIYGDTISYSKLGDIKSARWNGFKFDASRPLIGDANYVIAKTAQQTIQNVAESMGNDAVAQLNRFIGDRLEAAKYLDLLNGTTVKGGRLQKYLFQAIGASMGKSPLGKILGAFGGDAFANLLLDNQVNPILKRKLMSQIQMESPAVYKQTIEWLSKAKINPQFPIALPSGEGKTPVSPTIHPPVPTTFEPQAQKIGTTDTGVQETFIKQISDKYNIDKSLTAKIIDSALKELGIK